jgi:hypothetical protein
MPTRPKLQIPNPLPRPRRQLPIPDRNRHTRSYQRTLDMRLPPPASQPIRSSQLSRREQRNTHRHIILPLRTMPIQPAGLLILRH